MARYTDLDSDHQLPEASLDIRVALPQDAAAIELVLREAFAEHRSLLSPSAFGAATPDPSAILARFAEGPIWVATVGGEVVGTASGVLAPDGLYVRSMAVLPKARGQGIGRMIACEAETYAREQHCARLFLTTRTFMTAAIRVYEKSGFERTDEPPYPGCEGSDLFTMVKVLKPISQQDVRER